MKDILIEIDRLAEKELERANKTHQLFVSDHEGESVIREEIEEALDSMGGIGPAYEDMWNAIRENDGQGAKAGVREIRASAAWTAAELIQVIAMCDKFVKSQEARMEESNGSSGENR